MLSTIVLYVACQWQEKQKTSPSKSLKLRKSRVSRLIRSRNSWRTKVIYICIKTLPSCRFWCSSKIASNKVKSPWRFSLSILCTLLQSPSYKSLCASPSLTPFCGAIITPFTAFIPIVTMLSSWPNSSVQQLYIASCIPISKKACKWCIMLTTTQKCLHIQKSAFW